MMQRTLPAFTTDEYARAHSLLATRVAYMMGRKLEESDWTNVYCAAKGIPEQQWSNLNIDVIYEGLGVEHKMLCMRSDKPMISWCGTSLMHPALTRSIRIDSIEEEPETVMRSVFAQYAELVESHKAMVRESNPEQEPDLRIGWLLWQESLREFLYFEYEMTPPDPNNYWAEWHTSKNQTTRKPSKNLWIYHKETSQKRYSVTTQAGIKIQPYFDVPPPNDPNLYLFTVQGELIEPNFVRIWVTVSTVRELERLLGSLKPEVLSEAIIKAASALDIIAEGGIVKEDEARPIVITKNAYDALYSSFEGVSDEHRIQLVAAYLREH